jgi:hypothetical protein
MPLYGTVNKTNEGCMTKKCKKKDYTEKPDCKFECDKCRRKANKSDKLCKPEPKKK